jgi:DNA (cytosine-5)-methyltransferase 1
VIEHIGSLCSGFGGLDRALSALLGLPFGWHAEIEKLTDAKTGKVVDNPVCELLAARYPGVPNHGDITAIDWASLGRPRALAAGFPCQGVSAAGLQLGDADPRWLWPAVRQGVEALRPEWVAIENVANLVSIQGGRLWRDILADLAELGYAVAWGIFGACLAEVRGCHHRHRVFALARRSAQPVATRWTGKACGAPPRRAPLGSPATARDGEGRGEGGAEYWDERGRRRVNGLPLGAQVALLPSPRAADASGGRIDLRVGRPNGRSLPTAVSLLPTPAARSGDDNGRGLPSAELAQRRMDDGRRHLDDALSLLPTPRATVRSIGGPGQRGSSGDLAMPSAVQPQNFGRYAWAVGRWTSRHGPAPQPTEPGPRGGVRMAATFPEWMMGLAPGFVTDVLPRKAALHAIGNGVMPLQAYVAFGHLAPLLP